MYSKCTFNVLALHHFRVHWDILHPLALVLFYMSCLQVLNHLHRYITMCAPLCLLFRHCGPAVPLEAEIQWTEKVYSFRRGAKSLFRLHRFIGSFFSGAVAKHVHKNIPFLSIYLSYYLYLYVLYIVEIYCTSRTYVVIVVIIIVVFSSSSSSIRAACYNHSYGFWMVTRYSQHASGLSGGADMATIKRTPTMGKCGEKVESFVFGATIAFMVTDVLLQIN